MLLQPAATGTTKSPLFRHRHRQHGGLSSLFPSGFSISTLLRPLTADPASVATTCSFKSKGRSHGTVDSEQTQTAAWIDVYRRLFSMPDPENGADSVLDQFENQGKKISKFCLSMVAKELRKFRRYKLALEVCEWMRSRPERFRMNTSDFAMQLDLISKVHGISCAENYFSAFRNSVRDGRIYGALLNAYAEARMKEKAESLFDKMREQNFMDLARSYNVMMTLYMKFKEYDKVEAMVSEMMEKNIPMNIYSYNIRLSSLGSQGSVEKMEQTFEMMKLDTSIDLDWSTYATVAIMYVKAKQSKKAEDCLKQIESIIQGKGRVPYHFLISLYGNLGKKEEVCRIWNVYKSNFHKIPDTSYRVVISSLVRSGDIEGAENIYDEWVSIMSRYNPKIGNILLAWYVRKGLTEKAKVFFNEMIENGGKPNSITWEILAKDHIRARRTSEAISCLKNAVKVAFSKKWRPKPAIVSSILHHCEQENDVASQEQLFEVLKQLGCLEDERYMMSISNGTELVKDDNSDDEESDVGSELLLNELQGSL